MKNILIIGANGFTGRQILNDLSNQKKYNVTGCSLHPDICSEIASDADYHFIETDIRKEEAVNELFERVQPDVVINCSALSVPDYCELHHEEADLTNITAVEQLGRLCREYHSRFIHLSTDFVFNGEASELYTEEDTPAPVNYYGVTKWKGEERIAEICHDYAIARVAIVYGKALPGQHGNIVQLVINRLQAGQEIRVTSDQWRTPTYVKDVSDGVQRLIESTANGIFHICGSECLTIAEIAYQVADTMHLDRSFIHPITTEEMQEATPRPLFSGMSIEKARKELGYRPHTLEEAIKEIVNIHF